jgi:hypothetical protein
LSDKAFWIEILSRHGEVVQRHRIDADEARIGRAYDNQIILDDPHVGAHHARVVRQASGELIAEDLGSANGLFEDESRQSVRRIVLSGDRPIKIGATRVRVRDANYAVVAERQFTQRSRGWQIVMALGVAVVALQLVATWLGQVGEPRLADYAGPVVALCSVAVVWAGMWAILARIFSGNVRFRRNLLVALSGLLVLMVLLEVSEYGAFALSRRELVTYRYAGLWLVLALFTFLHLRVIGVSHLRLKASAVALIAVIGIAMQTLFNLRDRAAMDRQHFVRALKPPALRLARPESESAFFAQAADLRKALERARRQQPPEGDEPTDYGDED